jgi:RNA polymerase sigma-70 factor (ECF subfamily)
LSTFILQQVARSESGAFARCLDEYGGLVWSIADRQLRPLGEDVDDAVQDIFVEVWKSASRYDPTLGSEAAFIATIAHHRVVDRVRRSARRLSLRVDDPGAIQELKHRNHHDAVALSEDMKLAAAAFDKLDQDEQQVLWYSLYHGIPHEKIASLVQLPLGTVKSRIRRGLVRMREAIGGHRAKEVVS